MLSPALYLIPVTLGNTLIDRVLPEYNKSIILQIKHFIVEDVRTARRFLKKLERSIEIDDLTFYVLNKRTPKDKLYDFLAPLQSGEPIGLMSEAGCPAVADPGSDVVAIAHEKKLKVVPLVGPSSILLSVMASGFNGQSFSFHGYLPIKGEQRIQKIKELERRVYADDETQLLCTLVERAKEEKNVETSERILLSIYRLVNKSELFKGLVQSLDFACQTYINNQIHTQISQEIKRIIGQ